MKGDRNPQKCRFCSSCHTSTQDAPCKSAVSVAGDVMADACINVLPSVSMFIGFEVRIFVIFVNFKYLNKFKTIK